MPLSTARARKLLGETLKFNDALTAYRAIILRQKFLSTVLSEYACNDNNVARVSRVVFSGLPECTRAKESRDVHFARAL